MRLTQLGAGLIVCLTGIIALPTRSTEELAPRAFASGSTTCYSQCPSSVDGYALTSKNDLTDYFSQTVYHQCYYQSGGVACNYYDDGSLYSQYDSTNCPTQAPSGGCGATNPDSSTYFKRRSVARPQTNAERIIQARQYKPKRD
ncbi:hypothetical protein V865_006341 [Kwoniella europaea PYCC6329]|uniref:Uncharacterized protein n=1 Tax=Kwoniella europaea PYCC6329 TaxID=1423913 RepID=A0AAX4KRN0_9TREE